MAIAIPTLAVLVLLFALPNYLAIRYAVFGGSPVAPVTEGTAAGSEKAILRAGAPAARRRFSLAAFTQRGYGWKMFSPFLFSFSVILGLAVGGTIGIAVVSLALLNLVWGAMGWGGYVPGRK